MRLQAYDFLKSWRIWYLVIIRNPPFGIRWSGSPCLTIIEQKNLMILKRGLLKKLKLALTKHAINLLAQLSQNTTESCMHNWKLFAQLKVAGITESKNNCCLHNWVTCIRICAFKIAVFVRFITWQKPFYLKNIVTPDRCIQIKIFNRFSFLDRDRSAQWTR